MRGCWVGGIGALGGQASHRGGIMPVTIGRRELVTALGSVAVWLRVARAQQPKVPTIGALVIGNADPEEFWRVFREGLRDLGYVEGPKHSICVSIGGRTG